MIANLGAADGTFSVIGWRAKPLPAEVDKPKGFDDFELRLGDLMRGERATMGKSLLDIQRDLKIKATYIAAIENADVSAFETPGFIAGYIRSYARYLGMNPDWAFEKFCREANFEVAHGMSAAASSQSLTAARARQNSPEGRDGSALSNGSFSPKAESLFANVEPGAIGSFSVLLALVFALGYGGWSVLQEVQRVQLSPIEQAPEVVAELDPIAGVEAVPAAIDVTKSVEQQALASAAGVYADPLDRAARPEALDLPVLTARDGPISGIDPRTVGALTDGAQTDVASADIEAAVIQVVAEANPGVELLAVRPAWVQVAAADGTVLFEKILDAGERYSVPALEEASVLRAGNSGSVYFVVNGATLGPAAPGANVVKNIALTAESLSASYALADMTGDADLAQIMTAENLATTAGDPADAAPNE